MGRPHQTQSFTPNVLLFGCPRGLAQIAASLPAAAAPILRQSVRFAGAGSAGVSGRRVEPRFRRPPCPGGLALRRVT